MYSTLAAPHPIQVIDASGAWVAGTAASVVSTGDVVDRGPDGINATLFLADLQVSTTCGSVVYVPCMLRSRQQQQGAASSPCWATMRPCNCSATCDTWDQPNSHSSHNQTTQTRVDAMPRCIAATRAGMYVS